jgi:hypothetical protein
MNRSGERLIPVSGTRAGQLTEPAFKSQTLRRISISPWKILYSKWAALDLLDNLETTRDSSFGRVDANPRLRQHLTWRWAWCAGFFWNFPVWIIVAWEIYVYLVPRTWVARRPSSHAGLRGGTGERLT